MIYYLRHLLTLALVLMPFSQALGAAGITQILVKDFNGVQRSFNVYSSDGTLSGNLMWNNVWCDPTTNTQCVAVDASGRLTVLSVQSGTWNITNISGTVSLPTGASTSAKQPALGTAGAASADVITVQGIASMTALKVDGSAVTQPISGTVTANQGGTWTVQPGNTANTTPWLFNLSTAVVPTATTMQNAATANGNGTNLSVSGYGTAIVNVNCSVACSGGTTINFEATDSTGTFFAIQGTPVAGGSGVTTATTTGQFVFSVGGLTSMRARISGYSAGTITVTGSVIPLGGAGSGGGSSGAVTQSGNWTVRVVGNTGAVLDATTTAAASPANGLAVLGRFNSSAPTLTDGQTAALQVTAAGSLHTTVDNATPGIANNADSITPVSASSTSPVPVNNYEYTFDGTNWNRVRTFSGLTGVAPPAGVAYMGANTGQATTGGKLSGLIACDNHVFKHITSATDTVAVQGVASQTIYICGWRARAAGTATWYLENTASTNNNCSSTLTQLTGVATEAANTGETLLSPFWTGLKNTAGNGLCINSTGTGGVDVDVWYTQF